MPDEVVVEQPIPAEEIAAPEPQAEETPVPAAGETEPTNPETEAQKHKGGFQRRIDKLTREKADAAREAEFWRQQALRQPPETPKTETAAVTDAEPSPEHFQTQGEYLKALAKHMAAQQVKEFRSSFEAEQSKKSQQQEVVSKESQLKQKIQDFATATPDYEEVVTGADVPVSDAMKLEILDHEHGPALIYFLAKNPDEASRLAELNPTALAREIGRLESRFVPQANTQTPSARTVTQAPKPPTPVTRSAKTEEKDPGEMSMKEYRAWRAKTRPEYG